MVRLKIQKGSRFSIPFAIKVNDTIVTASNYADVRIKIGDILKTYSEGTLLFDSQADAWLYPLTEDETWEIGSEVEYQVSVKSAEGDIYPSEMGRVTLGDSIITEVWDD